MQRVMLIFWYLFIKLAHAKLIDHGKGKPLKVTLLTLLSILTYSLMFKDWLVY